MNYFLGLDIGKDSVHAALVDREGRLLQQQRFGNDATGFAELLAWLPCPAETLAVCEPTGVYGMRLQRALATALGSLHEINAQILRRFSFSQVRTKTDEADALSIAEAARTLFLTRPERLAQTRVVTDDSRENLALWLNEYDRLRNTIVALRNQLAGLDHHTGSDVPLVRARRKQELNRLEKDQRTVIAKIQAVYQQLDDRQAELIDSIPGIGTLTTAATLMVIPDIHQFETADSLKAYLGSYPRRNQSGNRETPAHMARHGNRLFRFLLWNAAKAAVWNKHPDNPFRKLFDRLRAKGKSYNCAIGAVCRKLVQTIYGVLKSQTPFHFPAPPP